MWKQFAASDHTIGCAEEKKANNWIDYPSSFNPKSKHQQSSKLAPERMFI